MEALDGFVCMDSHRERYGYVVFSVPSGDAPVYQCGQWCWPATAEGYFQARQQLVRVIDRLQAQSAQPAMRAYA